MKKTKTLLLTLLLIGINSFAQELTCLDFKNGNFYVPADNETVLTYRIIRNENEQREIVEDPENTLGMDFNKSPYEKIEWIDDCTYRVKYDESKMELSEYQKFVNDNNGILTEMVKIEGRCFYFKATLDVKGEIEVMNGKICKE
ncbi:hypothetical protein [Winogradskyella forsetii]|uniref:hypothetical protein n=1 Tax=Winogradskyella forsetii TaxID=2686077 RepID=UPI0015B97BC3|nr:hypothetical protein [Winogradskyella forsetii]